MRSARKHRIKKMGRFHNLQRTRDELRNVFDIDLFENLKPSDVSIATRMFHRRHVYEHNGGEVDQTYLDESGDKSVRLKEEIRETKESAHEFASIINVMLKTFHDGFHDIFPPNLHRTKEYEQRKRQMNA